MSRVHGYFLGSLLALFGLWLSLQATAAEQADPQQVIQETAGRLMTEVSELNPLMLVRVTLL